MDFVSDEVVVIFNPGDTTVTVNIPIIDDGIVEPTEFLAMTLRVEDNTDGRSCVITAMENSVVVASIRDSGMYVCMYV